MEFLLLPEQYNNQLPNHINQLYMDINTNNLFINIDDEVSYGYWNSLNEKIEKFMTEDLGITFEHAFCKAKEIEFVGEFKYCIERSNEISIKIYELIELLPELKDTVYKHTAINGSRYDFTEDNIDNPKYLSLKTNKRKGGKVAPQVIGQPSVEKFCEVLSRYDNFNITYTNNDDLKKFISENISDILKVMIDFTFDCPNLYYNEEEGVIKYIKLKNEIIWDKSKIGHTGIIENGIWYKNEKGQKVLTKSKSFKYNNKSIIEIQFHDKNRKNMAIRWYYNNLLDCFKDNFEITTSN